MEPERAKQIWEEIIAEAESHPNQKLPEEKSFKEFREQSGWGKEKARNFLLAQVKAGKLKVRKMYSPQHHAVINLYSPVIPSS